MKYIRTKDGNIFDVSKICVPYQVIESWIDFNSQGRFEIIKQADTIEELCDEFVVYWDKYKSYEVLKYEDLFVGTEYGNMRHDYFFNKKELVVYGAIWTDKGLIYVAKMNEKGELELI